MNTHTQAEVLGGALYGSSQPISAERHIELLESQIQLLQSEVSNLRQFMRDMCCDPVDFEEAEEL